MNILCKFPTVNTSNCNFEAICIAEDLIWTVLKVIFLNVFFFFFFALIFQIFKWLYLGQIVSYPNKPLLLLIIQLSYDV